MKVITTRKMRNEAKGYFEMDERGRVAVKRGDKFVNLIVESPANKGLGIYGIFPGFCYFRE